MRDNTASKSQIQLQKMQIRLCILFGAAIITIASAISSIITEVSIVKMQDKVVDLLQMNNEQKINNVNAYLERIEDNAALFFSDEIYCEYDTTSDKWDEFEKIQVENQIMERIQDLAVLENYSDFGIVYCNDRCLGWLSNTTMEAFPNGGLFDYLQSHITNEKKGSGWFFDYDTSYDRLYYVKKLNENAVLITALYTRELRSAFSEASESTGVNICLVDRNNIILYADRLQTGELLPGELQGLTERDGSMQRVDGGKVVVSGNCLQGFKLISYSEMSVLFREMKNLKSISILVTVILIVIVCSAGLFLMYKVANPFRGVISELNRQASRDRLTNLINKVTFQELVDSGIRDKKGAPVQGLVMLDLDNFKKINDTLGHMEGDRVLTCVSVLFRDIFPKDTVIGRLGGDEFSVYFTSYQDDAETKLQYDLLLRKMIKNFHDMFDEKYGQYGLSISSGIVMMTKGQAESFDNLYLCADKALYVSKQSGKNQYRWYEG